MDTLTVSAGIIAVVRTIKEVVPTVSGVVTILVAVVLGGLAGYFNIQGLDLVSGVIAGLGAVGVTTVADRIKGT